jgi:hypothetical protein
VKITFWKFILSTSLSILTLNAYAEEWQCIAADEGGHRWSSTGMTQDHANTVALSFCTAYSPNSGSCHVSSCVSKE